ncbi:MAG: InlB B-repeat-containing protein [Clostridia bacterium]|nr:InlB B-repeat-containing protein [Clostridia bacterium]
MKNFKRILAIVLVVMMVVPMMTTGLSAATAEATYVYSNAGTEVAGGNWKAFVTNNFSGAYGADFALYDYNGLVTVDAEGQMCLYNTIQKDFAGYGFATPDARNVLQSTNTTAIDDLFMQLGFIAFDGKWPQNLSYAFSETQLQGSLTATSYTVADGFAVEDNGMVKDGLVITATTSTVSTDAAACFETITAYVMDGGKVVSSQTFEIDYQGYAFGLCVGHPMRTFFTFDEAGALTFHVEDTYSADGAYINQTYTFDELDMSTIKVDEKMYYLAVGSGTDNSTVNASININLARIGTVVDDGDGTYSVEGETKNFADWTGFGVASCEHVWGEYVEVTPATCTTAGILEAACQNGCGATDVKNVAAFGHAWSDWAMTVEPTCTEAGTRARTCGNCGEEQTDVAAATGHAWGAWYTTVEPDCVNDGMEQRDCATCGSYEENILPALGHTWVWVTLPDDAVNGERYCDVCGETETDLAYDYTYYWTPASNNKVGNVDEGYADYNDEFNAVVDGTITMQDMSLAYAGPYNYNTMLKLTSEFKSSLAGFTATIDTIEENNLGTALEQEYPTAISFLWTTAKDNYDGATEFSTYCTGLGATAESSRYGHMWNNYVANEYSLNVVLSDGCLFWGSTWYGELDDGEYDWLYYTVVSEGNYWTTKMLQLNPVVSAYEPITVSTFTEYNETSGKVGVYLDINGQLIELAEAAGSQLNGQDYYFSVATYADGANAATASFELTDVCYEAPATFAGYAHECSYYYEKEATCTEDGIVMCYECATVVSTTPATGHNYVDYVCTVCGAMEGVATVNGAAYQTLAEAIEAANDGDTIKLLAGVSGNDTYTFTKNVNLDLNGKTLRQKSGDAVVVDGATVTVVGTSGTVRSSDGIAVTVVNGGSFVIDVATTIRCSSEEGFNVFAIDDTSSVVINALGGRYYKDPVAAGATLADGLAIQENSSSDFTVIEAPVEPDEPEVPVEKAYTITFDPDGGVMPEGALLVLPINNGENYKEAAGYEYPVPTLEGGYVFAGWYWEEYNYTLYKGDWDTGNYAITWSITVVALYEECAHANWSDWTVTAEPTYDAEGEQTRTCADCGMVETEAIEKLERPWVITFDPDGGVMPEGVPTEMRIATNENYKEATGYDYPVPTLEGGYVFAGWYWELYNYVLDEGTWNGGYFAVAMDVPLVALYEECVHANWSDWTVTVEPSYTAEGEQERTCLDCGYVETAVVDKLTKAYTITFDADGGVMPEGALEVLPINYNENYKEAAGYDYPVPTLEGYDFMGWYWEEYNYTLTQGDWDGGYYAITWSITVVALYEEAAPVECPHEWSDWTVTVEPTYTADGEQTRTCALCGEVETEVVPMLVKDWKITFDPDGGVMPEGVELEYGINYMDNYKEATGIDYPVPTLDGYVFAGWYWELYNYVLDEGTWNGGYFAVQMDVPLVALYEEAPEVAVAVEGNTITVNNIGVAGVKDIFVAAGTQETYKDVKANMLYHLYATSYKVVDGTWSYDVSENGAYTVLVRYNDGTVEAKYFFVDCNDGTVADFVQDGATVTFNNLDDLYVLRYVAGEYDTSYAIKRAPGVVNVSAKYDADKIVNGSFSVTLEPGTYSFVTQFNDGNYVYYTVVVEAPVVEKDYTITFDPDGGVMPEGALLVLPINMNENYKEAAGYDYPVPTLEGYTFAGWYWEQYNYTLTEGDWDYGYYAINWSIDVVALYEEA